MPTSSCSAVRTAPVLIAVCLAALAMPLSFTGPAVALPALAQALGGSPITLGWVTNAFMLAFGSSLLVAGTLADRVGRKRVFLAGNAAFALVSAGLTLAPNIAWFDVLRAGQGLAAAASLSAGMAALAQEVEGPARMRAFSLVGTSFGAGLAFGPVASGLLLASFGWQAIVSLVVLCTGSALILGGVAMRESTDPGAGRIDLAGGASFAAALSLLTLATLLAPQRGWADPSVVGLFVAAILLGVCFVIVERRHPRPMLDLSLFRYPRFVGVQLLAAAPAYAFVVLLVLLPIRFIGVEGLSEAAAGRAMIALSGPLLVLPLAAALLARRFGPARVCGAGLLVAAMGLVALSRVPVGTGSLAVLAPMLAIGIGISLPWGLMDGLAVSVVPKDRAGMAAGIFNTTRVAGEGVALAVVGALLSGLTASRLAGLGLDAAASTAAAQWLASGNLVKASAVLPDLSLPLLVAAYGGAFQTLLMTLALVTASTAVVLVAILGTEGSRSAAGPNPSNHDLEPACDRRARRRARVRPGTPNG